MQRILLITNHDPLSTGYGAGQRTNLIWNALKSLGKTDVVWLFDSAKNETGKNSIDGSDIYKIETNTKYISDKWWNALASKRLTALVDHTVNIKDYDVVVSRYITPAAKLSFNREIPVLIDFDDPNYSIPWLAIRSPKTLFKEIIKLFNYLLINFKVRLGRLRHCHYMFVSSRDRELFPYLKGNLLPNIPHISNTPSKIDTANANVKTIIFIGMMSYRPNIEAVDFFLRQIWPMILNECPETVFRIVGKVEDKQKEQWQKHPHCIVDGFVNDLATVYLEADIAVSPILSGGGSNIKVPEACVYGCPVVATEYSYGGWSDFLRRDIDILVADNAFDFSEKCIFLLKNKSISEKIASSSSHQVSSNLSFESFCSRIDNAISKALEKT